MTRPTPRAALHPPRRPLAVYLVQGLDTDNHEIIGDLVPASSRGEAIRKVARVRPYMRHLTAQSVFDHLIRAAELAAIPLSQVQRAWAALIKDHRGNRVFTRGMGSAQRIRFHATAQR